MFFFFLKLPHSLDVSFLIVWDEAQFSGETGVFLRSPRPPLYIQMFFPCVCRGSSVLKALPTCLCGAGLDSSSSAVGGSRTQGADRPVLFSTIECVRRFQKEPIFGFRHLYLLNRAFFLFPSCCRSSTFCWIFTEMLAFWRGLPDFFLHGRFCMK